MSVLVQNKLNFVLLALARWINQGKNLVTKYLITENRCPQEKYKGKPIIFPVFQKKILAIAVKKYTERNHQGIASKIIEPYQNEGTDTSQIKIKSKLAGMLNYFCRTAV